MFNSVYVFSQANDSSCMFPGTHVFHHALKMFYHTASLISNATPT